MISIYDETKLKDGANDNGLPEKDLWSFLKVDPKMLAYLFLAFRLRMDYSKFNLKDIQEIFDVIYDDTLEGDNEVRFYEPIEILERFKPLYDLKDEILNQILVENLNSEKINVEMSREMLQGFSDYLKYQHSRNALVLLCWG